MIISSYIIFVISRRVSWKNVATRRRKQLKWVWDYSKQFIQSIGMAAIALSTAMLSQGFATPGFYIFRYEGGYSRKFAFRGVRSGNMASAAAIEVTLCRLLLWQRDR